MKFFPFQMIILLCLVFLIVSCNKNYEVLYSGVLPSVVCGDPPEICENTLIHPFGIKYQIKEAIGTDDFRIHCMECVGADKVLFEVEERQYEFSFDRFGSSGGQWSHETCFAAGKDDPFFDEVMERMCNQIGNISKKACTEGNFLYQTDTKKIISIAESGNNNAYSYYARKGKHSEGCI